jgi:transcriptional regulator with XRE-family HTH domain
MTTPASLSVTFGRRVRALRTARGWSQEQLGAEPGLTTASVRRIERGENTMLTTAERIANVFEVPLAVILSPDSCPVCHGSPPPGFTCQTCDLAGPAVNSRIAPQAISSRTACSEQCPQCTARCSRGGLHWTTHWCTDCKAPWKKLSEQRATGNVTRAKESTHHDDP